MERKPRAIITISCVRGKEKKRKKPSKAKAYLSGTAKPDAVGEAGSEADDG